MRIAAAAFVLVLPFGCSSSLDGAGPGSTTGDEEGEGSEAGEDFAPGCPSVQAEVRAQTPTVVLFVDRSGSMDDPFGNVSRWEAVYDTLMDGQSGLVQRLEGQVSFGLALYTGEDTGQCPIIDEVPPRIDNYSAIDGAFSGTEPLKDTPTGESLDIISASLAAMQTDGPKAIVVATDGLPDSCADPDSDDPVATQKLAVDAAERAYNKGISSFIISVGEDVTDAHLQQMANAGAGLPRTGAEKAPFYKALSANDLAAAFGSIVDGVRGCSFELDGVVNDASSGSVTLNGRPLDLGTDWQVNGSSTLELLGAACDEVLAGGNHDVTAVFECGGVTVE